MVCTHALWYSVSLSHAGAWQVMPTVCGGVCVSGRAEDGGKRKRSAPRSSCSWSSGSSHSEQVGTAGGASRGGAAAASRGMAAAARREQREASGQAAQLLRCEATARSRRCRTPRQLGCLRRAAQRRRPSRVRGLPRAAQRTRVRKRNAPAHVQRTKRRTPRRHTVQLHARRAAKQARCRCGAGGTAHARARAALALHASSSGLDARPAGAAPGVRARARACGVRAACTPS